jgi:hypothetical protein
MHIRVAYPLAEETLIGQRWTCIATSGEKLTVVVTGIKKVATTKDIPDNEIQRILPGYPNDEARRLINLKFNPGDVQAHGLTVIEFKLV